MGTELRLGDELKGDNCATLRLFNKGVTDKFIDLITKHCKDLESIDLSKCGLITDTSLKLIAERCKKLTHLKLGPNVEIHANGRFCARKGITNKGIKHIAEHCKHLTT